MRKSVQSLMLDDNETASTRTAASDGNYFWDQRGIYERTGEASINWTDRLSWIHYCMLSFPFL